MEGVLFPRRSWWIFLQKEGSIPTLQYQHQNDARRQQDLYYRVPARGDLFGAEALARLDIPEMASFFWEIAPAIH